MGKLEQQERRNTTTVAEIFQLVKNAKDKADKVETLKKFKDNIGVQSILRLQFDPRFKFALPEGVPSTLKENNTPPGLGEETILTAVRKLYLFIEGASPTLKQFKREGLFLGLLESLDKQEAELMLAVKDKKLDVGINRAIVDEVFPGLLPPKEKRTKNEKSTKEVSNDTSV